MRIDQTASTGIPGRTRGDGRPPTQGRDRRDIALYALTVVLSILGAYVFLQLWRADLRVLMRPPYNGYDSYSVTEIVKGFIEHGSFFANPSVGAPDGLVSLDRPSAETLHYAILGVIGLLSREAPLTVNLYYLLTYPLSALSAVFVMRRFEVSRIAALACGVLFAFVPFHYMRGTAHLFLAAYYLIPFTIMLALLIDSRQPPFLLADQSSHDAYRFDFISLRSARYALLAAAIGLSGSYWSLFACWFYIVGGTQSAIRHRSLKRLCSAGVLIGITVAVFLLQMIPTWLYRIQNGPNQAALVRRASWADYFGLRFSQLVLPSPVHRLAGLTGYLSRYWSGVLGPALNESVTTTLGVVGAIGFLSLLAWLLFATGRRDHSSSRTRRLMDSLSVLNISGLLLGTVGGVGALFGIASPLLRGYNRISIFLSFIALFAVGLIFDRVLEGIPSRRNAQIAALAAGAALLVLGMLDQVIPAWQPDYESLAEQDRSDRAIVAALEGALPLGSMVFQLPYESFPEGEPNGTMQAYQHFRAYLHSRTLKWSYGAMKGRDGDTWEHAVAMLPTAKMVSRLRQDGFAAIWVDRTGYEGGADALEAQLAAATGNLPLVSQDRQIAIYRLD